jgi:hypothetical protein
LPRTFAEEADGGGKTWKKGADMKYIHTAALTALFLLAGTAGLRAQVPDDKVVNFPEYGVVRLPEISTAAAAMISSCGLVVSVVDEKGVLVPVTYYELTWQKGVWQDDQRRPRVQLPFPTKLILARHTIKPRYRLEYTIVYMAGSLRPSVKITNYLSTDGPQPFMADAVFPLDAVTLDVGGLKFSGQGTDPGLKIVKSTISRTIGGVARKDSASFAQKSPQTDVVLFDRGTRVTAEIFFACNYKGKMIQLPWDDNGKPLDGLTIRLAQPDCPQ